MDGLLLLESGYLHILQMGIRRKIGIGLMITVVVFVGLVVVAALTTPPEVREMRESRADMSLDQVKAMALVVTYDDLVRHNEDYVGSVVYMRGSVSQILRMSDESQSLNFSPDNADFGETLWVEYTGPRVVVDDRVEMYGFVKGLKSVTGVFGDPRFVPELETYHIILMD